jgi:hypothetical protein
MVPALTLHRSLPAALFALLLVTDGPAIAQTTDRCPSDGTFSVETLDVPAGWTGEMVCERTGNIVTLSCVVERRFGAGASIGFVLHPRASFVSVSYGAPQQSLGASAALLFEFDTDGRRGLVAAGSDVAIQAYFAPDNLEWLTSFSRANTVRIRQGRLEGEQVVAGSERDLGTVSMAGSTRAINALRACQQRARQQR